MENFYANILIAIVTVVVSWFGSYFLVVRETHKQIQIQERYDAINSMKEKLWELKSAYEYICAYYACYSCDQEQFKVGQFDEMISKKEEKKLFALRTEKTVLNDLKKLTNKNKDILSGEAYEMLEKLMLDVGNHENLLKKGADEELLIGEAIADIEKIRKKLELLKKS